MSFLLQAYPAVCHRVGSRLAGVQGVLMITYKYSAYTRVYIIIRYGIQPLPWTTEKCFPPTPLQISDLSFPLQISLKKLAGMFG